MTPEETLARARAGWAEALDGHPLVTADELVKEVTENRGQLWAGESSDVFTRVVDGPGGRVLEMGPVAGDLDEMLSVILPKIEMWAKAAGCTEIHVTAGRHGWTRVLRDRGYEEEAVLLRKDILWD